MGILDSIKSMGFESTGFIWNRDSLQVIHLELIEAMKTIPADSPLYRDLVVLKDQYEEQALLFKQISSFLAKESVPLFKLKELDHDIHSVEAMSELSRIILKTSEFSNS